MNQPIDTEPNIRKKVGGLLAERLVRNAVMAIQAEDITPRRELVVEMVKLIAAMRDVPKTPQEAQLAVETIKRTLAELEAGDWDERIQSFSTADEK